ncbi:spindle pole body protein pcp1-like [Chelonus insularis]|uniref:spindle pole body protein pcp1-like n=1 Tax=Chelonus insularis TaxID=460826 RepID=UPI001588B4BA|nr:spindle pole body protein pcp1-like [Chelonus insularis]
MDNAWTSFKTSLDQIDIQIRSYSVDMRGYAPNISKYFHTYKLLQKEENYVRNKNIRLHSPEKHEKEMKLLDDAIKLSLQAYSINIKFYNDKIDELQRLIKYMNQTDSSAQSFNQLISFWNVVYDNFEHLIGLIKNQPEIVNNMKQVLLNFVSSMQNIQLIKMIELEDAENQAIEKNILIENLQKQVSHLTEKNSELLNNVETLRKNLDEQQAINSLYNKEEELTNENNKLERQLNTLKAENQELRKQYDTAVRRSEELHQRIGEYTNLQDIDDLQLEHQREFNSVTKEKEKLINENNKLKKLHDEDNKVNAELHKKLDEQRKTINDLNIERDELYQKLMNDFGESEQQIVNDAQDLKEQLSTAVNQLTQKEDHNNSLMIEVEKLKQQNNIQEGTIKNLTEESVRNNLRISDLENQIKPLKKQTLALETEKRSENQKEIKLKQKYEETKSENESLRIQIQDLTNQLSLVQAGPSVEPSTEVSDRSYSRVLPKRKARSNEDTTKRAKLHSVSHWQAEKKKLYFTDSYVTSSIDSIDENNWKVLQKQIKELNQKLNGLHDKLAVTFTRYEAAQKLRNKNTKITTFSNEMENIIKEIRQQLEINRPVYSKALENLILEINTNYEKDIELQKDSQSVYVNLINSIIEDYTEKKNIHREKIRRLIAKQDSATSLADSNKITTNLEKENEKWNTIKTQTNTTLKELHREITQFIERYNERNEKRKKLLFSIKGHLVNNIYSEVINELLISVDKLID